MPLVFWAYRAVLQVARSISATPVGETLIRLAHCARRAAIPSATNEVADPCDDRDPGADPNIVEERNASRTNENKGRGSDLLLCCGHDVQIALVKCAESAGAVADDLHGV
jgi:hypothetical protein